VCILAGCDYSESLKGIGFLTALDLVLKFARVACDVRLKKICDYYSRTTLAGKGGKASKAVRKTLPSGYLERVSRAELLFHYQLVYDPVDEILKHFSASSIIDTDAGGIVSEGRALGTSLPAAEKDDLRRVRARH
jgi:5'-3' exonuclease